MLIPAETSTASTLLHGAIGVAVVVGTLVFLVGVCNVNAWFVRLVESPRFRKGNTPLAPTTPAVTTASAPRMLPDHLVLVLAAAAAHFLEEEVRSIEILDVQPYSPWKLEGRMAIHRGRLTSKGISAPAFPAGGRSK